MRPFLRNRSWINSFFWLAWACCALVLFSIAPADKIESRCSILLAVAALWVNLYPRFVQGPTLACVVNQVTLLGIPAGNQLPVLIEIAVSDLISGQPSAAAKALMGQVAELRAAVERRHSDYLLAWFRRTPPRQGLYVPPDALIRPLLLDSRTTPTFFIPLFMYNSGAKYGEIGSVLMIAELISDPARKWCYAAYFEIDESKLIHIDQRTRDLDKISAFFPGHTIPPNGSIKLNLYFIPHHQVRGAMLSTTSMIPGTYNLRIVGLNPSGKEVFNTDIKDYPLSQETLLCSFKNSDWTFHAHVDESLLELAGSRQLAAGASTRLQLASWISRPFQRLKRQFKRRADRGNKPHSDDSGRTEPGATLYERDVAVPSPSGANSRVPQHGDET